MPIYKPGRIVTIKGIKCRIKRNMSKEVTCSLCKFSTDCFDNPKSCGRYCISLYSSLFWRSELPGNCYFEEIKPDLSAGKV